MLTVSGNRETSRAIGVDDKELYVNAWGSIRMQRANRWV